MKFRSFTYFFTQREDSGFVQIVMAYSGNGFTEFEKHEIMNKVFDLVNDSSIKHKRSFYTVKFDFFQGLKSVNEFLKENESYSIIAVIRYKQHPEGTIEESAYYLENGNYIEEVNENDSFAAMGSGSEYLLGAYSNFEGKFDDETLKKCFEIASRYDKNTSPTFDKLEFQGSK